MGISKNIYYDRTRGYINISSTFCSFLLLCLLAACSNGSSGGSSGGGSVPSAPQKPAPISVLTHSYDNNRSGWNSMEPNLTVANVTSGQFGLQSRVALDEKVDTQPLVVAGLTSVGGHPTNGHDVVYVTTDNNTIYAIDSQLGTILSSNHLGPPVPNPLQCSNNGPNVGINGTGVIDKSTNTMYVITYTLENNAPIYRIHALDITTLQDRTNMLVSAVHATPSGQPLTFNAGVQRQRAALLLQNGNVYAAFSSFCDYQTARGWVLGWQAGSLSPLPANTLTNVLTSGGYYLSTIWMSGSGLASINGNIVAVTGNSDAAGLTNDAVGGTNYSESVITISPDLTKIVDWFTPPNLSFLEANDEDFGSGGVTIIPGTFPSANGPISLLAAAGKDGTMYVLNAGQLGHSKAAPSSQPALATAPIGYCWCKESYFVGMHGPTIVSSAGGWGPIAGETSSESIQLWAVAPGGVPASGSLLTNVGQSPDLSGAIQDGGIFTSISSYAGNPAIIWTVTRAGPAVDQNGNHPLYLYAFSENLTGGKLTQIFKSQAGIWRQVDMGGNPNIVPVVANGKVYVASDMELDIFGLN